MQRGLTPPSRFLSGEFPSVTAVAKKFDASIPTLRREKSNDIDPDFE